MLSSPHQTTRSRTLFLSSMYRRSDMITSGVDAPGNPIYPRKIKQHFEELSKYGEIESLNVRDNLADHMVDDVNVQFREQERASNALQNLTGRASEGFSTVTGFCEATWIHEQNVCNRGGLLGPGVRGVKEPSHLKVQAYRLGVAVAFFCLVGAALLRPFC